jgi:hypothetical protein
MVDQHGRARSVAGQVEGDHLRLGEGSSHRVAVDHRETGEGGCRDRDHRVAAADLDRHHGSGLAADGALDRVQGSEQLGLGLDALDTHRRRTDPADRDDEVVVSQVVDRHQRHRSVQTDQALGDQRADVGVAPSSGTEHGSPESDLVDVCFCEEGRAGAGGHAFTSSVTDAAASCCTRRRNGSSAR